MDALFIPVANAVGASVDQLKLISCLLVAFPLGSIFIRLPSSNPTLRHLFNIGVTLFFFFPVLKIYSAFAQLLAISMAVYFLARFNRGASMPWIAFAITLGHLMTNHIIRALNEQSYETIEVTGPQMVLTMKLTTFAWNVWDGRRPAGDLDKWQAAYAVKKFPSIIEFLGYVFYFPGVLVGPYLEYNDYLDVITERLFVPHAGKENSRKIPKGRKRVAYLRMLKGLAFLGIYVVFGAKYNYTVLLTPWFEKQTLLYRIVVLQFFGFFERTKYYAIWTLTEGASILTGHGFTGFGPKGESLWNGAANVKVRSIECPPNFKILLDSWNMKANVWLRECVYKRVTAKGAKPGFMSSMLTFATSAFWHGAAVGYYLTFLFGGFITTAARLARRNLRPLFMPPPGVETNATKRFYDFLTCFVSILMVNYATTPFMLLDFGDSIKSWSLLGWYGHIIVGGGLVFFYAGGAKALRVLQVKEGKQERRTPHASGYTTPVGEMTFTTPPTFDEVIPPKN